MAIRAAAELVAETPASSVPLHLRSTGYRGAEVLGHGAGYAYPHDHPDGLVPQQYLPDEAVGRTVYRPSQMGDEKVIAERLAEIDEAMGRKRR